MAKNFTLLNIPGCQIIHGTHASVFMFNSHKSFWPACACLMFSAPGLYTGFFIGTQDEFIFSQCFSFPESVIQVQYSTGFLYKLGIPGKYPTSILPGLNGILMKPTPNRRTTDLSTNIPTYGFFSYIVTTETRQWNAALIGKLASQSFDLDNDFRGKNWTVVQVLADLQDRQDVLRGTFSSTCLQFDGANSGVHRWFCYPIHLKPSEQFLPGQRYSMVTYILWQSSQVEYALFEKEQWKMGFSVAYLPPQFVSVCPNI